MTAIAVLGLGNFGTALSRLWSLHGNRVRAWTVEEEVYLSVRDTGVNAKYLPGVQLAGAEVTMDLNTALDGAEVVALALPSHVILDVVVDIAPLVADGQLLLDLAKGLAPGERLVSEAILDILHRAGRANELAVMTGPTIAREVAAGVLTTALVAAERLAVAEELADRLSTDTLKLHYANDPLGVELWGAFKNVIALACGVCDGWRDRDGSGGDNLKAAVFTAGFREAQRLLSAMGGATGYGAERGWRGRSIRDRHLPARPQPAHGRATRFRAAPRRSPGQYRHGIGGRAGHPPVCGARRRRWSGGTVCEHFTSAPRRPNRCAGLPGEAASGRRLTAALGEMCGLILSARGIDPVQHLKCRR